MFKNFLEDFARKIFFLVKICYFIFGTFREIQNNFAQIFVFREIVKMLFRRYTKRAILGLIEAENLCTRSPLLVLLPRKGEYQRVHI